MTAHGVLALVGFAAIGVGLVIPTWALAGVGTWAALVAGAGALLVVIAKTSLVVQTDRIRRTLVESAPCPCDTTWCASGKDAGAGAAR